MPKIMVRNLKGHAKWMKGFDCYIVDRKHLPHFVYWFVRVSKYFAVTLATIAILTFVSSALVIDYYSDNELNTPIIAQGVYNFYFLTGHSVVWHTHKWSRDYAVYHLSIDPKSIPEPPPLGYNGQFQEHKHTH